MQRDSKTPGISRTGIFLHDWLTNHPRQAMGVIVALAILLRAGAIYYAAPLDHVPGTEMANVAHAILSGRGFADAYGAGTGPTAHVSPLYPMLLAGVYSIFGFGSSGVIAQAAFGLIQVIGMLLLMLPLSRACAMPPISALIGALLFSLPLASVAERGEWEAPLSALSIQVAVIATVGLYKRDTWSAGEAVTTGLLCGTALLITPPLALWFPVLAVGGLLSRRARIGRFLSVAAVVAAVVLSPWMIRNYRTLGSPIWSRSNFGTELVLGHNNHARAEFQDLYDSGIVGAMHPLESEVERRRVGEVGEVAYSRARVQQAWQWAYMHPRREATLLCQRVFHFWFPTLHRRAQTAIAWGFTFLGLAGLVTRRVRSAYVTAQVSTFIVATLFVTFPLVYYLLSTSGRYLYPLIPILMLFAGDFARRTLLRWNEQPRFVEAHV